MNQNVYYKQNNKRFQNYYWSTHNDLYGVVLTSQFQSHHNIPKYFSGK